MRCAIAKSNPVLMDLAAGHYLKAKGDAMPTFTFKSLYSDEEPYSLAELIFCLGERIAVYETEFKQLPTDSGAIILDVLRRKRAQLIKVLAKADKEQMQ